MSKDPIEKYIKKINTIAFDISFDADCKEETLDNRTDKWKSSEKGKQYRSQIDKLYELESKLREILEECEN